MWPMSTSIEHVVMQYMGQKIDFHWDKNLTQKEQSDTYAKFHFICSIFYKALFKGGSVSNSTFPNSSDKIKDFRHLKIISFRALNSTI